MKLRRMLSILLVILTVTTCAVVAGTAVASGKSADLAVTSAYQDMLAKTSAEDYGLAPTVNEGTILQAWNWSFKNIEANLEKVASQGFTTIQVSPPNIVNKATAGVHVLERDGKNGWWRYYQPAGFTINTLTDNAMGTKTEFESMCTKAHSLGLKIIVDAVINHMGCKDGEENETSTDPMKHVTPMAATYEPEIYNNKAFHTPWANMTYKEDPNKYSQYESTYDLTRNCTSRLPDLDTGSTIVQTAIYDYMDELIASGADGFRFDAAKHIETPDDISSLRSNFWTNTLGKVRKKYAGTNEVYAYGEILNNCGVNRPFSMYTKLFDVTDSSSYWGIKDAACNGSGNATPYYPSTNFTKANTILWDESHDTYMDGATTSLTTTQRGKIWALVAGRADITTVYFARPDDSTSTNACYNVLLGDAKSTSWANATTKAINQFHNYFVGQSEYCTANSNGWAYIERGTKGVMIVHLGGSTSGSVSLKNNNKLTAGTYIDSITKNKFTVTASTIKGSVGSSGVACLYYDDGSQPSTSSTTATSSTTRPTTPQPTSGPIGPDVVETRDGYYTVIFSNSMGWGGAINYYCWNDNDEYMTAWPGDAAEFYDTNDMGQNRYIAFIPEEYPNVIFNNCTAEGGSQTADYALFDHIGLYPTDETDGSGHYIVGEYEIPTTYIPPEPESSEEIIESSEPAPPASSEVESTAAPESTGTEPGGRTYVVGDADMNKVIEITDVTAIQRHLANLDKITDPVALKAANADEKDPLEIIDATRIQQYLAKIEMETNKNIGTEKVYA